MSLVFQSTKTYTHSIGLSSAFRQWRAESHCRFLHGYSLEIVLTFEAKELDVRNWVVDFGSLKDLKGQLEDTFDHKTVVAEDDPELDTFKVLDQQGLIQLVVLPAVGCEKFAELIYEATSMFLETHGYKDRCICRSVEVKEHGANSAKVVWRDDNDR